MTCRKSLFYKVKLGKTFLFQHNLTILALQGQCLKNLLIKGELILCIQISECNDTFCPIIFPVHGPPYFLIFTMMSFQFIIAS